MKVEKAVSIGSILSNPEKYSGKVVSVKGMFMGWKTPENIPGPPFKGPPETRSDWIIADETGWIYVSARSPAGCPLNPMNIRNIGKVVRVVAEVKIAQIRVEGKIVKVPYLYAIKVEVKG